MMQTAVAAVVVVLGIIIFAGLIFACWKGEKVGRSAHLPFRNTRRKRKLRAMQAEEEGRYSESWASTQLEPYPLEAADRAAANDTARPSTPPPAYFPRDSTSGRRPPHV
jgi:FtsZ-interacting cell division protein ZipA